MCRQSVALISITDCRDTAGHEVPVSGDVTLSGSSCGHNEYHLMITNDTILTTTKCMVRISWDVNIIKYSIMNYEWINKCKIGFPKLMSEI